MKLWRRENYLYFIYIFIDFIDLLNVYFDASFLNFDINTTMSFKKFLKLHYTRISIYLIKNIYFLLLKFD